jgi:hypothetical protein
VQSGERNAVAEGSVHLLPVVCVPPGYGGYGRVAGPHQAWGSARREVNKKP